MKRRQYLMLHLIVSLMIAAIPSLLAPGTVNATPSEQSAILTLEFSPPGQVSAGTDIPVTARTTDPSFSTIRIVPDCGVPGIYELGSTVATFVWHTSGCTAGEHLVAAETRRNDNPSWEPSATILISQKVTLTPGSPPSAPTALIGDINWDCMVDYRDLMLARGAVNNFISRADVNNDGVVNSIDVITVRDADGQQCQSPPSAILRIDISPPTSPPFLPIIGAAIPIWVQVTNDPAFNTYSTYRVTLPCGPQAQQEVAISTIVIWQTAGCAPGTHQIHAQARRFDDPTWSQAISASVSYALIPPPPGPHQVTGRVTDQSSVGIGGATVELLDAFTKAPVSSTSTDTDGNYSLTVAGGTYDLRVTPPPSSPFTVSTLTNQLIGTHVTLDVVLVPVGSVVTVSGTVRDRTGAGVSGQTVSLGAAGASTDISGTYTLQVPTGSHILNLSSIVPVPGGSRLPAMYYLNSSTPLAITADTTLDLTLPSNSIDVHVQGPAGEAIGGAFVSMSTATPGLPGYNPPVPVTVASTLGPLAMSSGPAMVSSSTTDGSGRAILWAFPTSGDLTYTLSASPPPGNPLGVGQTTGVTVAADTTATITLATTVTVSGTVRDRAGAGVPGLYVGLGAASASTDVSGAYTLRVPTGSYQLNLSSVMSVPGGSRLPAMYHLSSSAPLAITADTTLDLTLPSNSIDVHVQGPAGEAIGGAFVSMSTATSSLPGYNPPVPVTLASTLGPLAMSTAPSMVSSGTTDGGGQAIIWVFPTSGDLTYTLSASPPPGSPFGIGQTTGVTVATDTTATVTLSATVTVSGTVRDRTGAGVPGHTVGLGMASAMTDASGAYALHVPTGSHQLNLSSIVPAPGGSRFPAMYHMSSSTPLAITADTTLDLTVPTNSIDVHVQGPAGESVSGAFVSISASTPGLPGYNPPVPVTVASTLGPLAMTTGPSMVSSGATDGSGRALVWVFPTSGDLTYTLSASPPPASPYGPGQVTGLTVTTDRTQVVVLQTGVFDLPPIISGVQATGITDTTATITWSTNEVADTQVEYRATGGLSQTTTLDPNRVLNHSQPLPGLQAGAQYQYRALSRDGGGNLSSSPTLSFSTVAAPDLPPIISGVQATTVTENAATVTWLTNEPTDSQVEYRATGGLSQTTTLDPARILNHSQPLTGLQANTQYQYRALSRDAGGNLASSPTLSFSTGAPTDSAPVISGTQATAVTENAATVTWLTNEAADSQVEYRATGGLSQTTTLDPARVLNHSQPLTGLQPATQYTYRALSRDAGGNLASSLTLNLTTTTPPAPPSGQPEAQLTPDVLDFGDVAIGTPIVRSIVLTNTGLTPLSVSSLTLEGTNAADFTIVNPTGPFVLQAGQAQTITVRFTPTTRGQRTARLSVVDNAPGEQRVTLRGIGQGPEAAIAPERVGFGRVVVGSTATTRRVTIFNTGLAPLSVSAVTVSGSDASAFVLSGLPAFPASIAPGTAASFTVGFTPTQRRGYAARIDVTHTGSGELRVPLNGQGVLANEGGGPPPRPEANLTPNQVAFGDVPLGSTSSPRSVVVTNTGDAPLIVSVIALGGGQSGEFTVSLPPLPATLGPGELLTVQVRFSPSAPGQRSASLTVTDNAAGERRASLTGRSQGPEASVTPDRVTFGRLAVGSNLTRSVTVTNTGLAPLHVSSVSITGSAASDFTVSPAGATMIAPGATHTLTVTCTPTATGNRAARLEVNDDAPGERRVNLSCIGTSGSSGSP